MQAKTITVVIDENGNSTIDLAGFRDNSCAKVAEDFRGGDRVTKEHRKASATKAPRARNSGTRAGRRGLVMLLHAMMAASRANVWLES
jgi:hypothetical protein